MNLKPIKVAVSYALGLSVAVGFLALLTFIFSFLGTIFCAGLTGMMLGAAKCRIWKSFLCSLVFPSVLITLMLVSRSELPPSRLVLLAGLSNLSFWLTFAGAAALIAFEARGRNAGAAAAVDPTLSQQSLAAVGGNEPHGGGAVTHGELTLEQLQGVWSCRPSAASTETFVKTMEIIEDKLTLQFRTADAQVLTSAADIRIENRKPPALVLHSGARPLAKAG